MWSWDIKEEMRISVLNGNLVVRFTDYVTSEPFYSFLGNNKVNETVEKLLEFSKKENLKPILKLIPEITIKNLDLRKYSLEEDPDNFDYISDIDLVSEYKGAKFAGKRKSANAFARNFPDVRVEILDFKNTFLKSNILQLDEKWLENKREKNIDYDINNNESIAHDRFFQSDMENILGIGIFYKKTFIGYSIFEILPGGYSMSHFAKSDTHYNGINDYAEREYMKILKSKGCFFLNYEQDLGVPGLKESKKSFMSTYLKKFTICFVN
jgi:hypothetical protein